MIEEYLRQVTAALRAVETGKLETALEWLEDMYRRDRLVCLAGNGGSAANASHMAEDLCKGALRDEREKRFRVLSLTDNTPFITAVANDIGYEDIFVFQVRQFARAGDLLILISGSGNSPNVVRAAEYACRHDVRVMAFTGYDGGRLGEIAGLEIRAPVHQMCQVEAVHAVLMHLLVDWFKARLDGGESPP